MRQSDVCIAFLEHIARISYGKSWTRSSGPSVQHVNFRRILAFEPNHHFSRYSDLLLLISEGLSIQGTTSHPTLLPSGSTRLLPKNVTFSSLIEVFGCDMVAFTVFKDGGEVILAIILAWVFFFSE